ncbi:MAG: UMP kinase [Candidatus Norongarragalinales archaeon]
MPVVKHAVKKQKSLKKTVVLSLGGSLLYENGVYSENAAREKAIAVARASKKISLGIVVGGGAKARQKANDARSRGASEFEADEAAIIATRENARAFARALLEAGVRAVYCEEFHKAADLLARGFTPVMGGQLPGLTTDSCAVLLAELTRAARVVNATNVDGVYNKNPELKGARRFARLSHEKLVALAAAQDARKPGQHFVFDVLACKLAARSKIRIDFVDGRNAKEFKLALEGGKHGGTIVW